MISYKKAEKILLKSKIKIKDELILSDRSLNRVCSKDIYSPINYPSGNNAAFDGYAINSQDTRNLNKKNLRKFKILKTIAAGDNPKVKNVKKFQCVEIMTGALIPKQFDTIIPIEQIKFYEKKKFILVDQKIKKNNHVRFLGSDYLKKDIVIKKGTIINPSYILAFKSLGIKKITVKKKPTIIFFSTGNEITNKEKINTWQVRNSNSHYIKSLSDSFLFNFINGGTLKDNDVKTFTKIIKKNINSKVDIVITSGAVSAGKFDFVPNVIKKFNSSKFFKGVAIRPGKPILFAKFKKKEKVFFGLPGNPLSSAACFRFFVYPFILNILGIKKELSFKALLKKNFQKKKDFTRFLKGKISSTKNGKIKIEILKGQESFKIKSFTQSNVWGVFKAGQSVFKKGELIDCHSSIGNNKIFF